LGSRAFLGCERVRGSKLLVGERMGDRPRRAVELVVEVVQPVVDRECRRIRLDDLDDRVPVGDRRELLRRGGEVGGAVARPDRDAGERLAAAGDVGDDLRPCVPPPTATTRSIEAPAASIASMLWRTPNAVASSAAR
jgi:hypothetical protein